MRQTHYSDMERADSFLKSLSRSKVQSIDDVYKEFFGRSDTTYESSNVTQIIENCGSSPQKIINSLKNGTIYPDMFAQFENIKSLNLRQIEIIGHHAFYNSSIEEIEGQNVKSIGMSAFNNCQHLKYINFPNLTNINYGAFRKCFALEKFIIPRSIERISTGAFDECPNLILSVPRSFLDSDKSAENLKQKLSEHVKKLETY